VLRVTGDLQWQETAAARKLRSAALQFQGGVDVIRRDFPMEQFRRLFSDTDYRATFHASIDSVHFQHPHAF
jgi:hypothetical protein